MGIELVHSTRSWGEGDQFQDRLNWDYANAQCILWHRDTNVLAGASAAAFFMLSTVSTKRRSIYAT